MRNSPDIFFFMITILCRISYMKKLNDLKDELRTCTGSEHGRFVDPSESDNEPTDPKEDENLLTTLAIVSLSSTRLQEVTN
jgi:hypothetical protein